MYLSLKQMVVGLAVCLAVSNFFMLQRKQKMKFRHHIIDTTLPVSPEGFGDYGLTALVDIDKDGKLDFVTGGRNMKPATLYWYRFVSPDKWDRHVVGWDYLSDVGIAAHDIDGDGWLDLVCSGVWYRNTGNPKTEPFERLIFDEKVGGAHDIVMADIDGDGKKDVVVMGDEKTELNGIFWYKIPDNPREKWIARRVGDAIHGAFAPAGIGDINGDGYADIVCADTWFENKAGGAEWVAHKTIPMGRKGPFGYCVRTVVTDMDNDGKNDVVMLDADIEDCKGVVLYNVDGGLKWDIIQLPQSFQYGSLHSLGVADFNGDGLPDIVSNEQEELLPEGRENPRWVVWQNQGNRRFKEEILLDKKAGGHELQIGDVDGDGDIDIVSKPWGAKPWNISKGKIHVDFLENKLK